MAQYPMFPMWVQDYLADTSHLNATEHGVYHLLIYRYWLTDCKPLPNDLNFLLRVTKCRSKRVVSHILEQFWELSTDLSTGVGWRNRRVESEFRAAQERSSVARKNAKKGWKNRRVVDADAMRAQCSPSPSPDPEDLSSPLPSQESRSGEYPKGRSVTLHSRKNANTTNGYPEAFERLWENRAKRAGADDKKRALRAWNGRIADGHSPQDIHAGMERYRDYCRATDKEGTQFVMMTATFLGPADPPHFKQCWEAKAGKQTSSVVEQLREQGWFDEGNTYEGEYEKH